MSYEVVFSSRAIKDLRSIARIYQAKIIDKADSLSNDPRPIGSLKLKGIVEELWRVRLGDYRILYRIEDRIRVVDIRRIGHRKEVYK